MNRWEKHSTTCSVAVVVGVLVFVVVSVDVAVVVGVLLPVDVPVDVGEDVAVDVPDVVPEDVAVVVESGLLESELRLLCVRTIGSGYARVQLR